MAQTPAPRPAEAGEATPPDVAFGADEVHLDTRSQSLDVSGNVRVDEPPFHLTSPALKLRRVPIGVELDGQGRLAFCPCLGTPLAVRFSGATVAPPNDVILREPVVEVFGVPLAWAPAFWLRSPARPGLLPPDLAWRGADGFFAGGGIHVPWFTGDADRGIDLRAGGYVQGGVAIQTAVTTAMTSTRIGWDRLRGDDGLTIDAHGATDAVVWSVDALRGARAVAATSDVEAAARPFDRAWGESQWRVGGWTFASGIRAVALRGGDPLDVGAAGPVATVRRRGALADVGTYDATLEGGQIAGAGFGATTFARADAATLLAARFGPCRALSPATARATLPTTEADSARTARPKRAPPSVCPSCAASPLPMRTIRGSTRPSPMWGPPLLPRTRTTFSSLPPPEV